MTRILIFTLALLSAFFSLSNESDIPQEFLRQPKVEEKKLCHFEANSVRYENLAGSTGDCTGWAFEMYKKHVYANYCDIKPDNIIHNDDSTFYQIVRLYGIDAAGNCSHVGGGFAQGAVSYHKSGANPEYTCPPDGAPDFIMMYTDSSNQKWCTLPASNCPAGQESDLLIQPVVTRPYHCFDNADGSQCLIPTYSDGSYYKSQAYSLQSSTDCKVRPSDNNYTETPMPPEIKTPSPPSTGLTTPPTGKDADPSAKTVDLDALNLINKNLKAITDNQIDYGNANSDALNNIYKELVYNNQLNNTMIQQENRAHRVDVSLMSTQTHEIKKQTTAIETQTSELKSAIATIGDNFNPGTGTEPGTGADLTKLESNTDKLIQLGEEQNGLIKTLVDGQCQADDPNCTPAPVPCDPEKELCKGAIKAPNEKLFDKTQSLSLWESQYENGLQGVWDAKADELKNTGAIKFLDQFKVSASGTLPDMQICFNLGGTYMDFGCKALPMPDGRVLAFIKLCILITAAFACRKIIFGG